VSGACEKCGLARDLHGRVRNVVSQKLTFLIFFAFITSVLFSYFLPAGPLRMSTVGFPGSYFSTALREERARSPRHVALWVGVPIFPAEVQAAGIVQNEPPEPKAPLVVLLSQQAGIAPIP